MTIKRFYIGSTGPFTYDDAATYPTPADAGDQGFGNGLNMKTVLTEGEVGGASGVALLDTNASNTLTLKWNENDTVDRVLNFLVGGADRSITLSGNPTLADWFDQSVKTAASTSFAACSLGTGELTCGSINRASGTLTIEIGGTAEISVTSSAVTLGGNLALAANSITGTSVDINNAELQQLSNIGAAAISSTEWGYVASMQDVATTASPTFVGVGVGISPDADIGIYTDKTFADTDNSGKAAIRAAAHVGKVSQNGVTPMTSAGWGVYGQVYLAAANTQNWTHAEAGLRGVCGFVGTEDGSGGTVTNAANIFALASIHASGGQITNLHGVHICTPSVGGTKVTNEYGIYVCDQNTGATLNYAIYTNLGLVKLGDSVTIDQSVDDAAIPTLILDQADVSEEMIEFVSTIGVGNALEAVGGKSLTTTHFIKVTLPGSLARYIPVGTIA